MRASSRIQSRLKSPRSSDNSPEPARQDHGRADTADRQGYRSRPECPMSFHSPTTQPSTGSRNRTNRLDDFLAGAVD